MILSIGIDISRDKLDIYYSEKFYCTKNEEEAIRKTFQDISRNYRIVLESTSKYHRKAHKVLTEMGFKVMVIIPYQSKHFAKALNLLCKTDKVDAKMLSLFGERMDFKATRVLTEEQLTLQEISRHLDDLSKVRQQLEARRRDSEGFVASSLDQAVAAIKKEIEAAEQELKKVVKKHEVLDKKVKRLVTIPGIGEVSAITILCNLKELGAVSREAIAGLSGLAPMNHDSGIFRGKRRIQGGRKDIRAKLYMPIVGAATRHNPRLMALYKRLIVSGKPPKVALTACMRKLLVWANAMLQKDEPWQEADVLNNTSSSRER